MINESEINCVKTAGVLTLYEECTGCEVMAIVDEKNTREGDGSRAELEKIALEVARNYCPRSARLVLPKPSKMCVW